MTHFLDIAGKIADLQAILEVYKQKLFEAQRDGDRVSVERYEILIEETENKIEGMKNSPYLRRGQRQRQGIIVFEFAFSHFHFLLYCFRAVCSRNHRFLTPSDGRANKKRIPTNTEQESVLIPLRCQLCMRDILICCAGGTMYVVEL